MRYLLLLIFVPPLLLGLLGAFFTTNKLEQMEQIRGWKPGATVKTGVVRQKLEGMASGGSHSPTRASRARGRIA